MSTPLEDSTEHQPRARVALSAALATGPSHAYLFRGPPGVGKRAAARAFAGEILASAAEDPEDTRRRVLIDPSPHPDLVWLAPSGVQHLVGEIREQVIRASSYRPFEAGKRVFVIEAAEQMREESQNALLKTLEEPPPFAHMILISSEPEMLLETIGSRCQPVEFASLPAEAIESMLKGHGVASEVTAVARLSAGNAKLARFLLTEGGKKIRTQSLELAKAVGPVPSEYRAVGGGDPTARLTFGVGAAWKQLLNGAEAVGTEAEGDIREALEKQRAEGAKIKVREINEEAKRVARRRRTEVLDLGLSLCAIWYRDLAATASGATDAIFHVDRLEELKAEAAGLDPAQARRAVELVLDTRRRLDLNVAEELALEALSSRLERLSASPA